MTTEQTIEVDAEYLWALEVLACDSMGLDGQTSNAYSNRYVDALVTAENANLVRPRDHPDGREYTEYVSTQADPGGP